MSNVKSNKTGFRYLYHYFEKDKGPFCSISAMDIKDAANVMSQIKNEGTAFAAQRQEGYLKRRHELESIARDIFISKGGKPVLKSPHYMVVDKCEWLKSWYRQGTFVKIPFVLFNKDVVSFSYGDLFPTFSEKVNDGKEYRKQVYTYSEILEIIEKYGLPQKWNADGKYGPERYIEAHVWSDDPIAGFMR